MIQKVYKGSDIMIALSLKDAEGTPYRIDTTNGFTIRFFTTDPDTYIEGSYSGGKYTGIIAEEDTDYIALNALDLEKIEDGLLSYVYHIKVINASFKDGYYDEVVKGQTNLYLKSKCLCIK
uniref:Uncharacterized protein n=1 Tax=Siphoviridae sp. ctREU2 TaxID=2826333 RepID=A0A8S5NJP3_9CAUD|nr:MAG TPA: hypothetical protein [Siphoviridae sp. ctREU2]